VTLSTRTCSTCGLTVPAPEDVSQVIPDHWVQDPRSYGLVCGACHGRRCHAGWRPPARYEINFEGMSEELEQIKKGLVS
jgi:hypothetical protein